MVRYFTHLMKTRHRRKLLDELPVSVNRGAQLGKIKLQDVKRAIDIGKDVRPFVEPAVNKYGPTLIDWTQQRGKQAVDSLGGARDSFLSKSQAIKDKKERRKSLEAARKKAVASSLPPISAKSMSDKELAPISVEVVPVEDLENIRLVANADAGKENNVGIGERADAILGLASDVIDLVEENSSTKSRFPKATALRTSSPRRRIRKR